MWRGDSVLFAAVAGILLAAAGSPSLEAGDGPSPTRTRSGYAAVNGLRMYYEIHGTGRPLVLLHGGLGTIDTMFGQLLPLLARDRQVVAVELQGHGHTAGIGRAMSFEAMADDVAALVGQLGFEKADIFGYSLGGGVALQTAIRHPEAVRRLVLVSSTFKRDGWYPEVLAGMASMNAEAARAMEGSPMHEAYVRAAPRPRDWSALVTRLGQMLGKDYDWSRGVSALKTPTLIVIGDADSVRPAHAVELFGLLGGGKADGGMGGLPNSQLAVLPGTTHFMILTRTDLLLPIVVPFLDGAVPEGG